MGNFLGIYGSLAALTERHPVASAGDTAIIGGVVYYWNEYEYYWQDYPVPTDEQESGGSDSGSHQAPAHHATHKVGEYETLLELWEAYPDGGQDGDYAVVSGNEYYWDETLSLWIDIPVEDTGREVTKFDGDVTIGNDLYVGGRIHCLWVFSPYDRLFQRLYMRFSGLEDYVDDLNGNVTALQTRLAGDEDTIQQILNRIGDMSSVSCYNSITSLGNGVYRFSGQNVPDVTITAGGGGTPGDMSAYYTKGEIDTMIAQKVDNTFFNKLFRGEDSNGNSITVNSTAETLARIKAMKDFYSVGGVSALGYSSGGSGGGGVTPSLGDLLESLNNESMPSAAGYLHYTGSGWEWTTPSGSGGDTLGELLAGINELSNPATGSGSGYGLVWNGSNWTVSKFANWLDLSNYATTDYVSTSISGLARKDYVDTQDNALSKRIKDLENAGYLKQDAADARYVTIAYFEKLFKGKYGDSYVNTNSSGEVNRIEAQTDFYSIGGVSALGYSNGGSGGSVLTKPLSDINNAGLRDHPSEAGQTIVWDGTNWVYGEAGSDVDLSGVFNTENGCLTGVTLDGTTYGINASLLNGHDSSAFLPVDGVAQSASRLSGDTTYNAWGQPYWQNGVPRSIGSASARADIKYAGSVSMGWSLNMEYDGNDVHDPAIYMKALKTDSNLSVLMLHNDDVNNKDHHLAIGFGTSARAQLPIRFFGREFVFNYTTDAINETSGNYMTAEAMKIGYRQISEVLEEPAVYVRKHLMVGDGAGNYFPVTYDYKNNALCFSGDIYATGGISALGFSSTQNGGALINGALEVAGLATLRGGLNSIGNVSVHGNINAEGDVTVGSKIKMPNAASENDNANDAYIGVNTTSGNLDISGGDGGVDIDGTTVAINGATIDNNGCIETQSVTITNSVELNNTDLLRVKYNGTWYKLDMARAIELGLFVTE